jgi:hypothetical protein
LHPLTTHIVEAKGEAQPLVLQDLVSRENYTLFLDQLFHIKAANFKETLKNIEQNTRDNQRVSLFHIKSELEKSRSAVYLQELKYWFFKFESWLKLMGVLSILAVVIMMQIKCKIGTILFGCLNCIFKVFKCCCAKKRAQGQQQN